MDLKNETKLNVDKIEYLGHLKHFLDRNLKDLLPEKVEMLELLLRDGIQHATKMIPMQAKLWYADQIVRSGYNRLEVTNFTHPVVMPQYGDAADVFKQVYSLDSVREYKPFLKVYGMTMPAFKRVADLCQQGFCPDSVAFTISAEDIQGRRNSGRTREEYWNEIPEFVKIAKDNGFKVDCAIASVYGSGMAGPVPIENTMEIMDRALDMGIRDFTPCDTTGESNPLRSYLYMAALVDKYSKYDDEMTFRIAHFHEARGSALANTIMAILAGARIIETTIGLGGGQPSFVLDGTPGCGSGPLYTNSFEVGNCSTEDTLVALDEMGIDTGVNIDRMLSLGRVFEWTMERSLPSWCTKSGRPIKQPVEWNTGELNIHYIPPYPPSVNWADPSRYKKATADFIAKQFEGRKLRWDPWEEKVKRVEEEEKGKPALYSHGGYANPGDVCRASECPPDKRLVLPKKLDKEKK
jgi:hydroxymethylglutaryl-CoA lyase